MHVRITSGFLDTSRGQKPPYKEKHKRMCLSLYGVFWPLLFLRQVMVTVPKCRMRICDFQQWSNGFRRFLDWAGHLIGRPVLGCWWVFVSSFRVVVGGLSCRPFVCSRSVFVGSSSWALLKRILDERAPPELENRRQFIMRLHNTVRYLNTSRQATLKRFTDNFFDRVRLCRTLKGARTFY
jgi:hypothetical protein